MTIKHALVTGANRGVGKAIAEGLKDLGLNVTAAVRDPVACAQWADTKGINTIKLDLLSDESIQNAVHNTKPVDVLVNNAGVLFDNGLLTAPDDFDTSIKVMLRAPYKLTRHFSDYMIAQDYGRIVNISSDWGSFNSGLQGPGSYGIAKAGLNALTLAASCELPSTVKINAMCPGWVRTRMGGEEADRSPQEGAETALWLATLPSDGPTGGLFRDKKPLAW